MKINYKIIGKNIQDIRTARNMTQAELAEKVDLSVPYISYIENGNKHPRLETLIKIAAALGTTMDALLLGNQPGNRHSYQKELQVLLEGFSERDRGFIIYMIEAFREWVDLLK